VYQSEERKRGLSFKVDEVLARVEGTTQKIPEQNRGLSEWLSELGA